MNEKDFVGFKPCYKWITFNTQMKANTHTTTSVNGCFKPCYKWITFNTGGQNGKENNKNKVLNLVINGLPSIPTYATAAITVGAVAYVLNLVINGLPSILTVNRANELLSYFKF